MAASSVKSAMRASAPAGKSSRPVAATVRPQKRPSTTIGAAIAARRPSLRTTSPNGPEASMSPLIRVGPPRPERGCHGHPRPELPAEADRCLITYAAIGPYDGGIPVDLSALPGQLIHARDERRLSADQVAELIGDRGEHLGRPCAAGYQRGHAAQRGLLIGQPTQPRLVGWIMGRRRVCGTSPVGAGIWRVHKGDGSRGARR